MKPTVIFMGTKPGSVVALKKLLHAGWDIRAIVIPPNYDQSWMPQPSLADVGCENSIPVFYNQEDIPDNDVDFVISYMYRNLVKESLIQKAKIAALNFHSGPLPEFAGFAFYNLAILEGSKYYGCTCHHLDKNFDTGNLVKVRKFEIDPDAETTVSLERKTQVEMLNLLDDFIEIAEGPNGIPSIPQDLQHHRYLTQTEFQKLKVIDPLASKEEVQRVARAFWYPPYDCAHIINDRGEKIQVVPDMVLQELAALIHADDFLNLNRASK